MRRPRRARIVPAGPAAGAPGRCRPRQASRWAAPRCSWLALDVAEYQKNGRGARQAVAHQLDNATAAKTNTIRSYCLPEAFVSGPGGNFIEAPRVPRLFSSATHVPNPRDEANRTQNSVNSPIRVKSSTRPRKRLRAHRAPSFPAPGTVTHIPSQEVRRPWSVVKDCIHAFLAVLDHGPRTTDFPSYPF